MLVSRFKSFVVVASVSGAACLSMAGLAQGSTDSEIYTYNGQEITAAETVGLACGMEEDVNVCYDDIFEAEAAEGTGSAMAEAVDAPQAVQNQLLGAYATAGDDEGESPGEVQSGPGGIGVPPGPLNGDECGNMPDNLYEYNLPSLDVYGRYFFLGKTAIGDGWRNYNSTNNKSTTSFSTGAVGAKFKPKPNGEGSAYPYDTPRCTVTPNLQGTPYNNTFQSRRRLAS